MRSAEDRRAQGDVPKRARMAFAPTAANDNDPFEPPPAVGARVPRLRGVTFVAAGAAAAA
jgi:hypothetical protein